MYKRFVLPLVIELGGGRLLVDSSLWCDLEGALVEIEVLRKATPMRLNQMAFESSPSRNDDSSLLPPARRPFEAAVVARDYVTVVRTTRRHSLRVNRRRPTAFVEKLGSIWHLSWDSRSHTGGLPFSRTSQSPHSGWWQQTRCGQSPSANFSGRHQDGVANRYLPLVYGNTIRIVIAVCVPQYGCGKVARAAF